MVEKSVDKQQKKLNEMKQKQKKFVENQQNPPPNEEK